MIQRIQTVFWLLAVIALALIFFFPLATLTGSGGEIQFWVKGYIDSNSKELLFPSWPINFLAYAILLLNILTIFQYKRRVLQIRMTTYNCLLAIGLIVIGIFYALTGANELNGDIHPDFFSAMPVIFIILNLLAWRGVRRDYLMLKAVDRIR